MCGPSLLSLTPRSELAADGSQSPASPHAGRGRASTMTSWIPLYGRKASAQQQDLLPTTTVSVPTPERVRRGSAESAPGEMELNEMMALNKLDEELSEEADEVSKEHDLDRHVKHVLERKQKARRALRGLWAYLKTPMGAITAIYGFLVAFWGAAIVLFLLGWIPTNSKNTQDIWVEISSQVTNGLFTVTGVGLIPWRVVDTYRMSIIHTLKMRIRRRRKQRGLPPIEDEDDMPDPRLVPGYERVLTDKEEKQLQYQQEKFAQSQTWYRPHATATHRAFPITLALWNTILMDGNSFFQCILCGCMWGMSEYPVPPRKCPTALHLADTPRRPPPASGVDDGNPHPLLVPVRYRRRRADLAGRRADQEDRRRRGQAAQGAGRGRKSARDSQAAAPRHRVRCASRHQRWRGCGCGCDREPAYPPVDGGRHVACSGRQSAPDRPGALAQGPPSRFPACGGGRGGRGHVAGAGASASAGRQARECVSGERDVSGRRRRVLLWLHE